MRLALTLAATLIALPALACQQDVKFKPGEQQASFKGSISGDSLCSYTFTAKEAQKVTVWLKGAKGLEAILFSEQSQAFENGMPVILPKSGEYEVRVLQNRNAARRSSQAKPFTLRLAITDK